MEEEKDLKKPHIVEYDGFQCELHQVKKGDWGYIDSEFWWLWTSAKNWEEFSKLKEKGFLHFDRNLFYKIISDEEASNF